MALAAWAPPARADPTGDVTRSFNQRMMTKVRPGTYLRGEDGLPVPPVPDLAAPGEAQMMAEVVRHFNRMGQLDAILEVMQAGHDVGGMERVVEVTRRERQRFFAAMRALERERRALWQEEID